MNPKYDLSIGTSWRSYLAEVPAWGIVCGALAVSFWTQVGQVNQHGFAYWESLIWASSTDAGTIACLFLAREGAHRGTPTWGAWVLSVACALLSVQFNIVAGIVRRDWLSVEAHVWMPALALGVWYWLLHGRHRRWDGAHVFGAKEASAPVLAASAVEPIAQPLAPAPGAARRPRALPGRRGRVSNHLQVLEPLVRQALAEGREPSSKEAASLTGLSMRQARRKVLELMEALKAEPVKPVLQEVSNA